MQVFKRSDTSPLAEWWRTVDKGLIAAALILLGAGIVLSLAAGPAAAAKLDIEDPFHFVYRQAGFVLAAIGILLFIDCWNEYFWPLVITESQDSMTVQIGIRRFLDAERGDDLGPLMAGVVLVSLPAMAVFLWFQRRILETFVSAGLKG